MTILSYLYGHTAWPVCSWYVKQVARQVKNGPQRLMDMANKPNAPADPNPPLVYEIRIKGYLDQQWTAWFAGITITRSDDGETVLTGPVVDQAALHGLIRKVRDLGLPLIAVRQISPGPSDDGQ